MPSFEENLTLEDIKRLERETIVHALEATDWKTYGKDGAAAVRGRDGEPPRCGKC